MKRYIFGLLLGLSALSVSAQTVEAPSAESSVAAVEPVEQAASAAVSSEPLGLPLKEAEGLPPLRTTKHAGRVAFLDKSKSEPLVFRPSENLPEVTNEDLLRGMVESGKAPGKKSDFIGYLPKLKVLPCAQGCEGSDYEKAVREFIKGYRGDGKHFKERGEMVVQVRWFNVRPFLQRQLPYGSDLFGVSFIVEGKLVSLGRKSGAGVSVSAHELANVLGARLAFEMAFTMGVGARPSFLEPMNTEGLNGALDAVLTTGRAVSGMLGVEDVRPRVEPVPEAYKHLPAIDGVLPGEVRPIKEMYYINSLLF